MPLGYNVKDFYLQPIKKKMILTLMLLKNCSERPSHQVKKKF